MYKAATSLYFRASSTPNPGLTVQYDTIYWMPKPIIKPVPAHIRLCIRLQTNQHVIDADQLTIEKFSCARCLHIGHRICLPNIAACIPRQASWHNTGSAVQKRPLDAASHDSWRQPHVQPTYWKTLCLRPLNISATGPCAGAWDLSVLSSKVTLSAAGAVIAATHTAATSALGTDPGFMLSP